MNELRRVFRNQLRALVGLVALGGVVHLQVAAQTPLEMPTRLDRFHVFSNGNIVSNKYASAFEAEGIRLSQNARVFGTPTTGGVSLSKQLAINTRNGMVVAEATQKISARAIARGIGTVAGGHLGLALLTASVVVDLMDDAGVRVADGGTFEQRDPSACTADCYTYTGAVGSMSITSPSLSGYCSAYVAGSNSVNGYHAADLLSVDAANHRCYIRRFRANGTRLDEVYITPTKTSRAADPLNWVPMPYPDFEDRLTAANPGPAVLKELADKGQYVPSPDVADPARIQNPQPSPDKTTTKTNPDGSTETTVCRTTGTVQGNSVKLNEQCTVTMRDPTGNVTSTTTTDTDDADPVSKAEDSMLCSLFPDIVACAKLGEGTGDIPKAERNVSYEPESLFGSGTCPPDQTITAYGMNLKLTDMPRACNLLATYVKPIAILLAAFTALMIVAVGVPE